MAIAPLDRDPADLRAGREQDRPAPRRGRQHPSQELRLRAILVLIDTVLALITWTAGIVFLAPSRSAGSFVTRTGATLLVVAATLGAMALQQLYLARVCAVRTVELARLARASALAGSAAILIVRTLGVEISVRRAVVTAVGTAAVLAAGRALYSAWLRGCRARGRYIRPLLLVGAGEEAAELEQLVESQPDLGYRIVGVVGSATRWHNAGGHARVLGKLGDTAELALRHEAGVLIAVTALSARELNALVRNLLQERVRVHASSGLARIAQRRLRALPLGHEPLFYVEPASPRRSRLALKRAIDITGAVLGLVASAPVLALAAVAVKRDSPGPVLFRQERVGRDGRTFKVCKLRTMVLEAEALAPGLEARNEREGGPLFKLTADPRVTTVGRVLRETSIDELPQLWNVLAGHMSLVGPRPALPGEVAQFDEELLERSRVRPGLTGLWQLEARDNPSFVAYRRLDLFYVENWSLAMDLTIMLGTAASLLLRSLKAVAAYLASRRDRMRGIEGAPVASGMVVLPGHAE